MSDWDLQRKHLDLARRYRAGVFDFGDFFCAMQGKFDKRSRKADLRPEHKVDDYLDALVRTAGDFFEPYADLFITIAMGNHETSILKRHEVNLTNNFVKELNQRTGTTVTNGGYSGWLHFIFENSISGREEHVKLWYIHGYGGGGPVTRGVIQTNRKAVYLPDADIIVSGHTHDDFRLPIVRNRLSDESKQYLHEQLHIQVPTYKEEYRDGWDGFHIETGKGPKPVGATWLKFWKDSAREPIQFDAFKAR
jgi:hypothetical protein